MKVYKEQDYFIVYKFDSPVEYLQYYKLHKDNHQSTLEDNSNGIYAVFKKELKPLTVTTQDYDESTLHSLANIALQFNDKKWFLDLTTRLNKINR